MIFLPDKSFEGSRAHTSSERCRGVHVPLFLVVAFKEIAHKQKYEAQIGLHIIFAPMRKALSVLIFFSLTLDCVEAESRLPLATVFKGRDQFDRLVARAREENWKARPIGERTATVGRALVGTRYKSYTLEIDNRVEAPSVNFTGMDCWTFYEIALAFARMLD